MPQLDLSLSSRGSMAGRTTQSKKTVSGPEIFGEPFGYKYRLPVLSPVEFDPIHQYVLSVFDLGRQRFNIELKTVTNNIYDCPTTHHEYLANSDSLGVSMQDFGKPEEFHIWITPAYKKPVFKFYMTLVHELVHGYAGMKYGHNAHWRRWFYRTLWHLTEAEMIPKPADPLKYVCATVEHNYNTSPKIDPMLTILEAFSKAEKEHDQVKANYFKRLRNA